MNVEQDQSIAGFDGLAREDEGARASKQLSDVVPLVAEGHRLKRTYISNRAVNQAVRIEVWGYPRQRGRGCLDQKDEQ